MASAAPKPTTKGCGCVTMVAVVVLVILIVAISGGSSGSPSSNAVDATTFFRQEAAAHYHGTTATDDGRGCAKVTSTRFACTAYVRNPNEPNRNIDVYGVVTIHPSGMEVQAHLARGHEIQNWFADTYGGCQTDSCKGTVLRKPYHGAVTIGTLTIPPSR